MDGLISEHGHDVVGEEDHRTYKRMQQYYLQVGDMLQAISGTLNPSVIDDLLSFTMDDEEMRP